MNLFRLFLRRRPLRPVFPNLPSNFVQTLSVQDQYRFRDMLECFKNRQPYSRNSYSVNAVALAVETGNMANFARVADEWFRQSKSIFDRLPPDRFDAAKILANLGLINRTTNGRLFENLGHDWSVLEYFMDRMRDRSTNGFQNFDLERIVGALAGIRDFAVYSPKSIVDRPIFRDWIRSFGKRVIDLGPTDPGFSFLERRSAFVLFLLAGVSPVEKLPSDLFRRFCGLSKNYFDAKSEKGQKMVDSMTINDETACFYYSDAFLFWNYDPKSIDADSWRSWFAMCRSIFESHLKRYRRSDEDGDSPSMVSSLRFLSRVVSIASEFDQTDEFFKIYDLWKRLYLELNYRFSSKFRTRNWIETEIESLRLYFSDFVHNLGWFCKKLSTKGDDRRNRFVELLSYFDETLANFQCRDPISQVRALAGLKNFRYSLSSSGYEPSIKYYRMLENWCREIERSDSKKLSSEAATVMFLLRDMKLRKNFAAVSTLLDELIILFRGGFDRLADKDINRSLAYFGDACLNFEIDDPWKNEEFSRKYFSKAKYYLERCWSNLDLGKMEDKKNAVYFLSILADVAYRYRKMDEFRDMYELYQNRLTEVVESLTPNHCFYLNRTLSKMEKTRGFSVSAPLLDRLRMKSQFFVPKSARNRITVMK